MKLSSLTKYNIPDSILEAWRRRQGEYLLPLQERAIREGLLTADTDSQTINMFISAPTSAGKSFCGELASIFELLRRKKAVMLVPLKSIAEEKYRYYRRSYEKIGIRTIIVTGDHPENDTDFELGNFDLAVAIYEKFNRLLTANNDIIRRIGLVVIDEFQMIADTKRGVELEMALIKMISADIAPRIIALSAVIPNGRELAEWLDCRVVSETVRPIDLLQGVAVNGYYHFRSFNSGMEGREKFALRGDDENLTGSLIDYLRDNPARKLVFLKSKRNTISAAFNLASAVGWNSAAKTIGYLDGEEESYLIRSLKQTLSRGVAFHNADLTPTQRRAVERGYRDGEVKVIFSTTTLSMGVNLPAEIVLLETMKYDNNPGRKPSLVPISKSEFQNISGRAGRFGLGDNSHPGKAIALARSEFELEVLWNGYIDSDRDESLRSALGSRDLSDIMLDLAASDPGGSRDRLLTTFNRSWLAFQGNCPEPGHLDSAIDALIERKLLDDSMRPTLIGEAIAGSGLSVGAYDHYHTLYQNRYPASRLGWYYSVLVGPEFEISQAGLSANEYNGRFYEKLLYRDFSEHLSEIGSYGPWQPGQTVPDYATAAVLKAACLLEEWSRGVSVDRLEQRYQLHHGQILNLAETAAWLLSAVGRIAQATNDDPMIPKYLHDLSFNAQFGIDPKMKELYLLTDGILTRADLCRLERAGIDSWDGLIGIDRGGLADLIVSSGKLEKLLRHIDNLGKEDNMQVNRHNFSSSEPALSRAIAVQTPDSTNNIRGINHAPSLLELDGTYEKERYLVKIDGFPVRLTGKSFKYLAKLVAARLANRDGWIYKDDIESGFNQARYLYRLKQEMKKGGVSWAVFENNRLGYYRLDLEISKIRFNLDNLKNHYDFEIRDLAEQLVLKEAS